jgi:hypothetical protein
MYNICVCVYIYIRYMSPDQATEPATAPRMRPHGSEPARPMLTPRGCVDPTPCCPSHASIEPTDLARPRPRATQSFLWFAQPFLIKRKLFLSSWPVISLYLCYSNQPFFLRCSSILENSVILCCYNELIHSFFLYCSAIFYYSAQSFYRTQSFYVATVNSIIHSVVLNHFCYSSQPF